jgi:hypothetical protein
MNRRLMSDPGAAAITARNTKRGGPEGQTTPASRQRLTVLVERSPLCSASLLHALV